MLRITGIIVAILALMMLVLFMMPASIMGIVLERATANKLTLSDSSGTFWSGSGFLSIIGKDDQPYALTIEPLVWSINKLPLLWGEASGEFGFSDSRDLSAIQSPSRFFVSLHEGQVDSVKVPINISALLKLHKAVEMLKLGGVLSAEIKQLSWGNGTITTDSVILWKNMRSALVQTNMVGSYQIFFRAKEAKQIDIKLETEEGPLMLAASGAAASTGFVLRGTAQTEDENRADLQNLLMVLGVEKNGVRYFKFSGGRI